MPLFVSLWPKKAGVSNILLISSLELTNDHPDLGEILPGLQAQEGHGEDRGDSQGDPVRGRLPVEPEWNPGDDDDQNTRTIDLQRNASLET